MERNPGKCWSKPGSDTRKHETGKQGLDLTLDSETMLRTETEVDVKESM